MLIQYAAAAVFFALGAMAFEARTVHWTPEFLVALCWLVFVLSFGAIWLLYFLISRAAATKVVSLFYLTPPVTALIAWGLFNERMAVQLRSSGWHFVLLASSWSIGSPLVDSLSSNNRMSYKSSQVLVRVCPVRLDQSSARAPH